MTLSVFTNTQIISLKDDAANMFMNYILTPDKRRIFLVEGAINYGKGVVAEQYIQDQIDHIYIDLLVDEEFGSRYFAAIENVLRKRIGEGINIECRVVQELERNLSGKIPFMISKIMYHSNYESQLFDSH